jgi:Kef-type K+ transport system membrane component KefB/nucleotide-binding universal stress UspA family protein
LTPVAPTPHDAVFIFTAQIAILLFTARAFGEIAQRLKQPSVVGELLAGIVLGPSMLGHLIPQLNYFFNYQDPVAGLLLQSLSVIGIMLLLLLTGLETDLELISRKARSVMGTALGGLVIPLVCGFALGMYVPDHLWGDPDNRIIFALFLATAMSISAIPVIAKILLDMKLMRRDIGQAIIAAGMIDDTVGWALLSIVTALVGGKILTAGTVFHSVGSVILFIALSFTIVRWLVKKTMDIVQDELVSPHRLTALSIIMAFAWGWFGHYLGLEPMFGAFMIGIILGQLPRFPVRVHERVTSLTIGIFAPMFFAIAGLKVNITALLRPDLFGVAAAVLTVAIFSKVVGTYMGGRLSRLDHWTSLTYGAALNARGAMGIIIATIGLSIGIINEDFFSIIVIMAILTSLMAPTLLRFTLRHVKIDEQERLRLQEEESSKGSPIARIHRVLVPLRSREDKRYNMMLSLKSTILKEIDSKNGCSVTLLNIVPPKTKNKNLNFVTDAKTLFPQKEVIPKLVESDDITDTILDECKKNYNLLLLGASEQNSSSETLFSSVIDSLVRLSPCTTAIVHAREIPTDWTPRRILVPMSGSLAARHAVDFSFLLSSATTETVTILNIVVKNSQDWHAVMHDDIFERQLKNSVRMLEEMRKAGQLKGIPAKTEVKVGAEIEEVILEIAQKEQYDLIVLGTDVHPVSDRLFLGPRVERILRNAPCPVIVLNTI